MSNNPYTAPDELITGGHVTKECNSVTVLFDDIHYSLSSGQLNGGFHHTLGVRNQQLTYHIETEKDLPGGSVANYLAQEFEHIDVPVHFSTALLTLSLIHISLFSIHCDTSPLADRYMAYLAGLGFYGRNKCFINPTWGSYIVIGTVLTTLEFEPNTPCLLYTSIHNQASTGANRNLRYEVHSYVCYFQQTAHQSALRKNLPFEPVH